MNWAIALPVSTLTVFTPGSKSALINKINILLTSVSWTSTVITGGYSFAGASPQGYPIVLNIWDDGTSSLRFQVKSSTLGGTDGQQRKIKFDTSLTYQFVASPCTFFMSRPGVVFDVDGSSFCCGAVHVPTNCGLSSALGTITEYWFSFGDWASSPFFPGQNPRIGLNLGDASPATVLSGPQEFNINGNLIWHGSFGGSADRGQPRIMVKTCTDVWTLGITNPLYKDTTDMLYEAMIACGDTRTAAMKIRGQLYNCVCRSGVYAMDTMKSFNALRWVNYTDNWSGGSLWLLIGKAGARAVNYAY